MSAYALYPIALALLLVSFLKSREKTKLALKKAWKMLDHILPQLAGIVMFIGLSLTFVDQETIAMLLGRESGVLGMAIAAVVGSITLIPGFIAFPLAASLLEAGAGYGPITMFVTTLMMVGIVTMPLEISYFGKTLAVRRNVLAFLYAAVASTIIGALLS